MVDTKRSLRVFLCHASSDKPAVIELYKRLISDGVDAWLDKEKLIPGQDWQIEIPKAVKNSDVVIVCLSSQSITKEGFIQREIRFALDAADEKPEGTIFIIPARLENCEVPERLGRFQWVDLYTSDGYERLLKALRIRASHLGINIRRRKRIPKVTDASSIPNSSKVDSDNTSGQIQVANPNKAVVNKPQEHPAVVMTGIRIFYQARYWSSIFKTNVACEVNKGGFKNRYALAPDTYTLIALQPNVKYEITVGVVQFLINTLSFTAKFVCTLKEGEIQNWIFTPPVTSLGRSMLQRE